MRTITDASYFAFVLNGIKPHKVMSFQLGEFSLIKFTTEVWLRAHHRSVKCIPTDAKNSFWLISCITFNQFSVRLCLISISQ
jgi:hypothetical protein